MMKFAISPPPKFFGRRYDMRDPNNFIFQQGIKYFIAFAYVETAFDVIVLILANRLQIVTYMWLHIGFVVRVGIIRVGITSD